VIDFSFFAGRFLLRSKLHLEQWGDFSTELNCPLQEQLRQFFADLDCPPLGLLFQFHQSNLWIPPLPLEQFGDFSSTGAVCGFFSTGGSGRSLCLVID
jgi:hypothetical protein